jgi:hypothetical protein
MCGTEAATAVLTGLIRNALTYCCMYVDQKKLRYLGYGDHVLMCGRLYGLPWSHDELQRVCLSQIAC